MLHTAFAFLLLGHAKQIPKQFFVATTQTWSNFSFYQIFLSTDTWTVSYSEKQQSTAQPLYLFWNVFVKWYHLYMLWIARTYFKAWDMSMMMGFWIFKHGMHTSVHWVSCLSNVTFRWRNLPDNWHESTWVSFDVWIWHYGSCRIERVSHFFFSSLISKYSGKLCPSKEGCWKIEF